MRPEHGARARLRQWQASRRWIPNRFDCPLHETERMAEDGSDRLLEAARATGNWAVLNCVNALNDHARKKRRAAK